MVDTQDSWQRSHRSARAPVHYPESDGKPMGETDFHITATLYLLEALRYFFRRQDRIYVAADMLFYYEEGNPQAVKVPDVFVVKGVTKQKRRTYKLWEEKRAPCAVFEITSHSSRLEDRGDKRALYEMIGVREYFLFDPLEEYLSPSFQGFTLLEGYYQPMSLSPDGTLRSAELDVVLRPEETLLRVVDPASGDVVPTLEEAMERLEVERARAETRGADAANAAEAELETLRAELDELRRRLRDR